MFIGGVASAIVSLISMVWSARKILSWEPRELLQSGHEGIQNETHGQLSKIWHKWVAAFIVGAIVLAGMVGLSSNQASISFFGAGGMLLLGGLFFFAAIWVDSIPGVIT